MTNRIKQSITYLIIISQNLYGERNNITNRINFCTDVLIAYATLKNADSMGHELIRELERVIATIEILLVSIDKEIFKREITPLIEFLEKMKLQLPLEEY